MAATRGSSHILLSRVGHGAISAFFLACIAAVYLAAWNGRAGAATYLALAVLGVEGVLVLASGGNCPIGPLFQRLGDEKLFFELFLSPRAAKAAVPTLGAVAVLGALVLALRVL